MVLVACAMAFGFAWFDLPGHGASYVARSVAMGSAVADGHTLFLWGMLAVTLLMAARPQLFERHLCLWLGIGWVLGTASLEAFSAADSPWASAAAVAVTGFADVLCINLVIGLVLTRLCDRTQQMTAVALALAAKTLLVYGSDRFLGQTAQTALSIAVPTLCVACAVGAQRLMGLSAGEEDVYKRQRPYRASMWPATASSATWPRGLPRAALRAAPRAVPRAVPRGRLSASSPCARSSASRFLKRSPGWPRSSASAGRMPMPWSRPSGDKGLWGETPERALKYGPPPLRFQRCRARV